MKTLQTVPKVIGKKQTIKQVLAGKVEKVILAKDADDFIQKEICEVCNKMAVPVFKCNSKHLLGKESGIERNAAVIAVIKD